MPLAADVFATLVIIIFAALAAAVVVAYLYRNSRDYYENAESFALKPIDLAAFARVLEEDDEPTIRQYLGDRDYIAARRMRIRACIEYMKRARFNASVLLRLGERAIRTSDTSAIQDARRVMQLAVSIRNETTLALIVLRLTLWLPKLSLNFRSLPDRHAQLCHLATRLSIPRG